MHDLDFYYMTLSQGHDSPLDHGQQVCEVFQIQLTGKKLKPGPKFLLHVQSDPDLGDMTLGHCDIIPQI